MKTTLMILALALSLAGLAYGDQTFNQGETYTVKGTVQIVHYGYLHGEPDNEGDFFLFTP